MRLVVLLGTSPGVLHTTLCLLQEIGSEPSSITVYATLPGVAEEALKIAQTCPCPELGKPPLTSSTRVIVIELPFDDVVNTNNLEELRRILAPVLGSDTVLDVSGGRKAMAVAAALEAVARGSRVIASVIPEDEYERIRSATSLCDKTARQARLIIF
ncbi:CRISPR-associated ring nuclease [Pyrodictium abyssi]|uniref:CRISPR system ring nuclease SSO2081-like domain-containing protein n=1 Tax=Pyrodictium abyssi TaxID=54256 RepID=A0ABM8IVS9_9CREN|nr:hypothetical protein PABY_12340 [Pyrodictium abyssi]